MEPQSALATAFEPTPLPQVSAAPSTPPKGAAPASSSGVELTPPPPLSPGPPAESSFASLDESGFGSDWKSEYEAQVSEWRAKSAEQRLKAEEERKKWEEIRAKEEKERTNELAGSSFGTGWESLSASGVSVGLSSVGETHPETDVVEGKGKEVGLFFEVALFGLFIYAMEMVRFRCHQLVVNPRL